MHYILYFCCLVCLFLGLIYGEECEKETESDIGCLVSRIKSQDECETYLKTDKNNGMFLFYIKPFDKGELSISLHKRYSNGDTSTEITEDLFDINIDDTNEWYKIKIRRGTARTSDCTNQCFINTYLLELNDQHTDTYSNEIEAGNEIRVETVTALWCFTCDPRKPPPQSNTTALPPTQPSSPPPHSITYHIPVWQQAIIAAATLMLTIVVILMIVYLVVLQKRRKHAPALIKPTDHQSRLSRHLSIVDHIYEEVDPQGICAITTVTTNATNSTNHNRGSSHDSENSLYTGIN